MAHFDTIIITRLTIFSWGKKTRRKKGKAGRDKFDITHHRLGAPLRRRIHLLCLQLKNKEKRRKPKNHTPCFFLGRREGNMVCQGNGRENTTEAAMVPLALGAGINKNDNAYLVLTTNQVNWLSLVDSYYSSSPHRGEIMRDSATSIF